MKFEWNEEKRASNIWKHGFDFRDAPAIFEDSTVTIEDVRYAYDEQRWRTLGRLHGCVVCVIYTEHDDIIRVISLRKATRDETKKYYHEIGD